MAPTTSKLRGLSREMKSHFYEVSVKRNRKWIKNYECVYAGCERRRSGQERTHRLVGTATQAYSHAMRFHRGALLDNDKEEKVVDGGILKDDPAKGSCKSEKVSKHGNTIASKPNLKLQVLEDWTLLL